MNGYVADVSEGDEDSTEDVNMDVHGGCNFNVKTGSASMPSHRRKRSRKRTASVLSEMQRPAPSPIHPDIDISLCRRISSKKFVQKEFLDFSALPADSLATPKLPKLAQAATWPNFAEELGGSSLTDSSQAEFEPLQPKEVRSRRRAKDFSSMAEVMSSHTHSQTEKPNWPQHTSGKAQVISDVTAAERAAATTYSRHHRFLEEGIALTLTPRLLIDAVSPHRVVHANAAFSQSVIGPSANRQHWITQQNSPTIPKKRNLETALRDIVPDTDIHLIVYPVLGCETVSHYLVEISDESRRAKRRFNDVGEPSLAIG